jgi:hypothetical protein
VYTSRALKNCDVERAWESAPELEDGILYLLGPDAARGSSALGALARSGACVTLEWAVACSRRWSRAAGGDGSPPAAGGGTGAVGHPPDRAGSGRGDRGTRPRA